MNTTKNIYIIGIWWIWTSALARYYNDNWFKVYWSDKNDSDLIKELQNEWMDIVIWDRPDFIDNKIEKLIYSEAIPETNAELKKAKKINIPTLSYPKWVAEIANDKKLIAIAWTHWKSTTTALLSLILKNSNLNFTTIVWTLLFEFWWKNYFKRSDWKWDDYFLLEACEYKRSFLNYNPDILVITNIDVDHLDYYADENDYINAFRQLIDNIKSWWYIILDWEEKNSASLIWKRQDINYIVVNNENYTLNWKIINFPKIEMSIPWKHMLYDGRLAWIVWELVWIKDNTITKTLGDYKWAWRRMEYIWKTPNWNIIVSDYWHHPTEIKSTLEAIKEEFWWKHMLTVFQPHQYSRTLKLLEYFIDSFTSTDKLIIPNIYESRDSKEDKEKITTRDFIQKLNHHNKINWNWLENTLRLIKQFDYKNTDSVIVLMWAWDIDNLRYSIQYE